MRSIVLTVLTLALAACAQDRSPTPFEPIPSSSLTFTAGTMRGACDTFSFPKSGSAAGYCTKAVRPLTLGSPIKMTFIISGTPLPVEKADIPPATLRLFLWAKGDDGTCAGVMQQKRWWSTKADLLPGQQTITSQFSPELWTDCYGKSGAENPELFQAALNNPAGIGYTFGGQYFAGHGVYAPDEATFTLVEFSP